MPPTVSGEDLVRRYEQLDGVRQPYVSLWQDLADYILPRQNAITAQPTPGVKQTGKQYDTTGERSNQLLAAAMAGTLTSSSSRWFALKMRRSEYNDVKAITDWLEDCTDRMFQAFNQSNFSSEIHEVYLSLGAFGTASIFVDEDDVPVRGFRGLRFTAMPLSEIRIAEDHAGRVDTIFRKFYMTARAVKGRWGSKISKAVSDKADKHPDEKIALLMAIQPRKGGETKAGAYAKDLPWAACYLEYESKQLLEEGGYHEWPAPTPRWAKSPGEIYGRGPGHTALPDIKSLNTAVKLRLKAAAKHVDPPILVEEDGVLGPVKISPAALITYRRTSQGKPQPMEMAGRFDWAVMTEDKLQISIRKIFFADQLQLPEEGPQMTAREIIVRYELMQKILGPTLGRLEAELLNPTVERSFAIMFRAGAFAAPPQELLDALGEEGNEIDIVYTGPLALAQRSQDAMAIEAAIDWAADIAVKAQNPEILEPFDLTEAAYHFSEVRGVPSKVMRGRELLAKMRAAKEQAAQEAAAIQKRMAAAEEMQKKAPYLKAVGGAAAPSPDMPMYSDMAEVA